MTTKNSKSRPLNLAALTEEDVAFLDTVKNDPKLLAQLDSISYEFQKLLDRSLTVNSISGLQQATEQLLALLDQLKSAGCRGREIELVRNAVRSSLQQLINLEDEEEERNALHSPGDRLN